jgi:hypothetical protein
MLDNRSRHLMVHNSDKKQPLTPTAGTSSSTVHSVSIFAPHTATPPTHSLCNVPS